MDQQEVEFIVVRYEIITIWELFLRERKVIGTWKALGHLLRHAFLEP